MVTFGDDVVVSTALDSVLFLASVEFLVTAFEFVLVVVSIDFGVVDLEFVFVGGGLVSV